MSRIRDIVIGNCITVGILIVVLPYITMEVRHELFWNGVKLTNYRIRFF